MPDLSFGAVTQIYNVSGTIGKPLPGVAVKIVNPETYELVKIGEEGLVLATGANVMKGYLGKPELTDQVIVEGWYVTGDMGHLDHDGHLSLTGRLSRFAKVGGEMVPLEKIEETLHEILGTSERVCAVTCVPDVARGERVVVLYLESQLTAAGVALDSWRKQLGERGLPNLWVPGDRDYHSVSELPVLGSGKLNLKSVKELALSLTKKG
jgi:acyl-[acyl-carrier-protein]-phospholipid O-acyltransferase/long-chain-fatty-acid--[acyl-carrier-protein] ligase